jgi:hypothetical protein
LNSATILILRIFKHFFQPSLHSPAFFPTLSLLVIRKNHRKLTE